MLPHEGAVLWLLDTPTGAPQDEPVTSNDGWIALRACRWREARRQFELTLAEAPTPRAWEGLSWAAWWLDDQATVFDARERAFRGYREEDDRASAARVATWLAADQVDFNGALATANGWLERAQRLLEPLDVGVEHGWLAFQQGYLANIRGELSKAEELAATTVTIGQQTRVADLEMLGLGLQGVSLVMRTEVASGMRCLDEASAIALAGEAEIPISAAWTCCFMVTACTRVLDFERAFEWCDRIHEFAERHDSRYMLGFCRAEHATIQLWRGNWSEAEKALEEAIDALAASRPLMTGGPRAQLAELRRRQGRPAESRALLDEAGSSRRVLLCRAQLALDEGDARAARELAQRALRNTAPERALDRVPALELLVRAQLKLGDLDEACASYQRLREVAGAVDTAGLRARTSLVEGMVEVGLGRVQDARVPLENAIDGFEGCGAAFDAACARLELASALRALEREQDARREAERAHRSLAELGAASAAERAAQLLGAASPEARVMSKLSRRESEVLGLVSEGMTNRTIAGQLCISEHTVHRHMTSILRKLDVPTRTAAAALALRGELRSK